MAVSGAKEFQVEAAPADVMAAIAAVDRLPECRPLTRRSSSRARTRTGGPAASG